jgi:glycosyltransferase involved in cell wall biosynthesis
MKKPKVLLITNIIPPYRIPLYNYIYLIKHFDFKVIALGEKEANRDWKIPKDKIEFNYKILPGFHKFIWSTEIAIHLNWGLWKAIRKYDPDIIITSGYDMLAYWEVFLYCKIFKKKFILWNGTTLLSTGRINGFIGQIKQTIIGGADRYITYGTKAAEYLIYMGASKEHIHVGINTGDVNWFRKRSKKFNKDEDIRIERSKYPNILMLYVGRLSNNKGVSQILKALIQLQDTDIGLLIVGGGPQGKELKQLCKDQKLKNVYFKGFQQQDSLPRFYAVADFLILPTFKEVWGLVVNEALASGLYVLCSDRAGAAYDLIKEGWNGILFNPHSIEELVVSILKAKEQIEDIRARRQAISEHACQEFSIECSAKAFSDAVEAVISNKA